MTLSDPQKEIVDLIRSGEVYDVHSFLVRYVAQPRKSDRTTYDLTTDEATAEPLVKEFLALWNKLIQCELVLEISTKADKMFGVFNQRGEWSKLIARIVEGYLAKVIIPLPGLDDFVQRGYLTTEEYYHREERKRWEDEARDRKIALDEERQARKVSQRWTIAIGISGILVGLFTVLSQYFTYKTDRYVTVTNPHAFSDTTKVLILSTAAAQDSHHTSSHDIASKDGKDTSKVQTRPPQNR